MDGFFFWADKLVQLVLNFVWMYGIYFFGLLACSKLLGSSPSVFEIGEGPQIVAFTLGQTRYKLRLIPLGGRIGAQSFDSWWGNLAVFLAGATALLAGAVLAVFLFLLTGVRVPQRPGAFVSATRGFQEEEALKEGKPGPDIKPGDLVVRVDDRAVQDGFDLARELTRRQSGKLALEIEREGARHVVELERAPAADPSQKDADEKYLEFRSVTELEYPGFWGALKRTPAALRDVFVVQHRGNFIREHDQHLAANYVGFYAAYYFGFFVDFALTCGALLLVTAPLLANLEVMSKRAGNNPLGVVALGGHWIAVALLAIAPWAVLIGYGEHFAGSLFDSPSLMEVFRDFPANFYWVVRI